MKNRLKIKITGSVQGVGFRPAVYNYAISFNLKGYVQNTFQGVIIEVEGERDSLNKFVEKLKNCPPVLSRIDSFQINELPFNGYQDFKIIISEEEGTANTLISPDTSICNDCLKEVKDKNDRRFSYPFTNCTNCGPRFTIVKDIPYDRKKTTMSVFKMCPDCLKEYLDPTNRRFHAQPNSCFSCGPSLELIKDGKTIESKDCILKAKELLAQGNIIAIKGLGGYHLACDAQNEEVVSKLRNRKYREDKPFALMAKNIETIRNFCKISQKEKSFLLSIPKPIVLLKKKNNSKIAKSVAPKQKYLGFMLPYTPLHYLLFDNSPYQALVMTSGNISDEPISYKNKEALNRLPNIADYFLVHNREIHMRCDDSVGRIINHKELIIRRSRGYVPLPIKLNFNFKKEILACGGHLKNTFCLVKDDQAFISHHIGDLENMETLASFREGIDHFKKLFSISPEIIAHDLHPEYLSTKYALEHSSLLVGVQHHHAHIVSCMAENALSEEVIGVAFDGTGYGSDGKVWGGEFLITSQKSFKRIAHLKYLPMPAGEKAIKEPWRMVISYLYQIYGDDFINLPLEFVKKLPPNWPLILKIITQNINCPETSSMGRLFDAVSTLIDFKERVNYEGQAAIELEMMAKEEVKKFYDYEIIKSKDKLIINWERIIQGIVGDLIKNISKSVISAKFHNTITYIILEICQKIRKQTGITKVVLSGGVFQNIHLLKNTYNLLARNKFNVYTHSRIPPNDGGISLGQAVVANFTSCQ